MNDLSILNSMRKMPLMELPVSSLVIRLNDNKVVLISPGTKLTKEQLRSISGITDIIAPNLLHCEGVEQASQIFREARVWGPPGAKEKKPLTKWTHLLSVDPWPFQDEIVLFKIEGIPLVNEFSFLHRASKTLFMCDLVFNIHGSRGLGAWLILHLFGTYEKLGVSKFFMRHVKDMAAFRKSVKNIFAHEFENLIVSHGNPIQGNAKHLLGDVFEKIEI